MKKLLCLAVSFCMLLPYVCSMAYGEDDYPDPSLIPDESYRSVVMQNDFESDADLDKFVEGMWPTQGGSATEPNGIVSYTPSGNDNRIYLRRPYVNASDVKKIAIRIKAPAAIEELKVYFAVGYGFNDDCTFSVTNIEPSEDFQTIVIDTSQNALWSGTVSATGITLNGSEIINQTFDFDYVYFYGDYKPAYTDTGTSRAYEFDSVNYGFHAGGEIYDPVVYNGELWAKVTGAGSYIETDDGTFNMRARSIPSIRISYTNETAGTAGKLYFKTTGDYCEENSFEFSPAQGFGEYIIDTSLNENWTGRITGLKFVPSDAEGIVRIDSVIIDKTAGADDDYPDPSSIPDESYRDLIMANELESGNDIEYAQGGSVSVQNGTASYTPSEDDNRLYFKRPDIYAGDVKRIAVKVRIPVQITELTLYFAVGTGYSEERTFRVTNIAPSDEYQTISIDTSTNALWNGTITAYGITVRGAAGQTFSFDGVYFYGDYRPAYTEDERGRVYEFDSPDYGFYGSESVYDAVVYNSELWVDVMGTDSYFTTNDDFSAAAEDIARIRLSYNNAGSGTAGSLYFKTDGGYDSENVFVFDIVNGQNNCVIDTADNENWYGNISGIRFVPSDGEGTIRIGSLSFDKFDCDVRVNEGIIGGNGNLYGEAESLLIETADKETNEIVHSETVQSAENGSFEFSFELPDVPPEPAEYELIFSSPAFEGEFKKNIVYASADYAETILEQINAARTSSDEALLKTLIETNYKPLDMRAEIYEMVCSRDMHTEEIYGLLIGETAEGQEALENQLNEAALIVYMKYTTEEEWVQGVEEYDEYLKFKELPAYETYAASENKEEIAELCRKDSGENLDEIRGNFQKNVIITELKHAVAWGNVKSVLEANDELIGIDTSDADSLKTPSEVYRRLTEKSFSSLEEVKNAFENAVEEQKRKESSSSGGGGGGSTGGGSTGGGSGAYIPVVNGGGTATPKPTSEPETPEEIFNDLSGFAWAKEAIEELYDKGIVSGTGSGSYEPQRGVRREEFVKMLVAALNIPIVEEADFADVPHGAWYAAYIGAAADAGIVYGQGDTFGVGQPVMRQDAAAMIARVLQTEGTPEELQYEDCDEIADYAVSAVAALTRDGILSGDDNGRFRPEETLTRAEAAVLVSRTMERMSK